MKVGDLVKYVPTHLEDVEDDNEIGIVVDCCEDGWYWKVYWVKEAAVHHFTRDSLEVISEGR